MEQKTTERCPDQIILRAYLQGRLFGGMNVSILEHIKYCSPCLRQLASLQAKVKTSEGVAKISAVRYPSLVP